MNLKGPNCGKIPESCATFLPNLFSPYRRQSSLWRLRQSPLFVFRSSLVSFSCPLSVDVLSCYMSSFYASWLGMFCSSISSFQIAVLSSHVLLPFPDVFSQEMFASHFSDLNFRTPPILSVFVNTTVHWSSLFRSSLIMNFYVF